MVTPIDHSVSPAFGLARPRIVGLAYVAFYIADRTRSLQYYRDHWGFAESAPSCIKVNDRQFIRLVPEKAPQTDRLCRTGLETVDVEGMRRYLASQGVAVPPRSEPNEDGDPAFLIQDPDGHDLEFVQRSAGGRSARGQGRDLPTTRVSTQLMHCGFLVRNFATAAKFYSGILGCYETWRGSRDGKFISS